MDLEQMGSWCVMTFLLRRPLPTESWTNIFWKNGSLSLKLTAKAPEFPRVPLKGNWSSNPTVVHFQGLRNCCKFRGGFRALRVVPGTPQLRLLIPQLQLPRLNAGVGHFRMGFHFFWLKKIVQFDMFLLYLYILWIETCKCMYEIHIMYVYRYRYFFTWCNLCQHRLHGHVIDINVYVCVFSCARPSSTTAQISNILTTSILSTRSVTLHPAHRLIWKKHIQGGPIPVISKVK